MRCICSEAVLRPRSPDAQTPPSPTKPRARFGGSEHDKPDKALVQAHLRTWVLSCGFVSGAIVGAKDLDVSGVLAVHWNRQRVVLRRGEEDHRRQADFAPHYRPNGSAGPVVCTTPAMAERGMSMQTRRRGPSAVPCAGVTISCART